MDITDIVNITDIRARLSVAFDVYGVLDDFDSHDFLDDLDDTSLISLISWMTLLL